MNYIFIFQVEAKLAAAQSEVVKAIESEREQPVDDRLTRLDCELEQSRADFSQFGHGQVCKLLF